MDNGDLTLLNIKTERKLSDNSSNRKNKLSTSTFKRFYQAMMDSAIKKQKEAENRKKYRLSVIIQKLLAGIILTSDELQFLKENAPVYYNQAIRQQKFYRAKSAGHHNIGAIEPIDTELKL